VPDNRDAFVLAVQETNKGEVVSFTTSPDDSCVYKGDMIRTILAREQF
jgi:hypothetical protein